jgi:hypothetical protein
MAWAIGWEVQARPKAASLIVLTESYAISDVNNQSPKCLTLDLCIVHLL